jgi:hypothetical protein
MRSMGWKSAFAVVAAGAVVLAGGTLKAQTEVDLKQGWTGPQVAEWYGLPQGSRLVPKSWLLALEQPTGTGKFLDPAYIAGFRYLTRPGDLPVGFAEDRQDDTRFGATHLRWKRNQAPTETWVGMTCAACHTAEIRSGTNVMRVQGGPTLGDFQGLIGAFNDALAKTRADEPKFQRFAQDVLGPNPNATDVAMLRTSLASLSTYQNKIAAMNQTQLVYGPGRLDAVGYIFNKVALTAKPTGATANKADAPVSYPFLWNIAQHHKVQWNGIASNAPFTVGGQTHDPGALARNVGEVIGVFADIQAPNGPNLFYRSSVLTVELDRIEQRVATLKPPRWPRELPGFQVDRDQALAGKALFATHCLKCHSDLPREDVTTRTRPDGRPLEELSFFFPQRQEPFETKVDTDPWMACNAAMDQADTGLLQGKLSPDLSPFKARASNSQMAISMVVGVIFVKSPELVAEVLRTYQVPQSADFAALGLTPPAAALAPPPPLLDDHADRLQRCTTHAMGPSTYVDLKYKGRPLTGVWATGPFLHNGSVPTLWDLLQPLDKRPSTFSVGTREFNPKDVGFVSTPGGDNIATIDTTIPGNSNKGHEYGTSLLEPQRRAILEYLKVIGEPI